MIFIEMSMPPGYNPNTSLLPSGPGTIQPMSGGGGFNAPPQYNPSVSLLPSAGGEIAPYRGGFLDQPIQIITGGVKTRSGLSTSNPTATNIR